MTIPAYPLQWPQGWKRAEQTKDGRFSTKSYTIHGNKPVSVSEALRRVRRELERMNIRDGDLVVSTNLALRLDGLPRSDQREPEDSGAAVYWIDKTGATRCMAIDQYTRVADNLAAIAATLDAMRAIERHGGAEILDRAFTGFTALPSPDSAWWIVLGVDHNATAEQATSAYRRLRSTHHPDNGGDAAQFDAIQKAYTAAVADLNLL